MKRELRKKMEKEIIDFQRRMWEDEDDVYYRELDAERVKHELSLAQYRSQLWYDNSSRFNGEYDNAISNIKWCGLCVLFRNLARRVLLVGAWITHVRS